MSQVDLVNLNERGILDHAGDRVPTGLLSIASSMRAKGHPTDIYDLNKFSEEAFVEHVNYSEPDAVGISVYTSPMLERAKELAGRLKGKTRLVAGGYHATAMPESLLPYFDAVVVGEGENALERALREDGVIPRDTPDLNETPNINLNELGEYTIDGRQGTMITSRGCPYSCSFCGNFSSKVRDEPLWKMQEQIRQLEKNGVESVYFLDDMFTLREDRMDEIGMMAQNAGLAFRATTRADSLNDSKLDKLKSRGCEVLSLGVESGNEEILKRINKRETPEQIYEAVRKAGERGIDTKGFFIMGLPGETEDTARDTMNFSRKLKKAGMKQADFYYLCPFPGTPIWNYPEKFGITIKDRDFTKYLQAGQSARCVIDTEELSAQRIEELTEEARRQWKN